MSIKERLSALRNVMEENGVDIYIVPTADFHQSEYVGEYFKARKFITGFSGSAGSAVITASEARLWTDGRYFVQAVKELNGTTVELMKMGEPDVPTIEEYLKSTLKAGETIGFDGRVISAKEGLEYEKIAKENEGNVIAGIDLIDLVWKDRPSLSKKPVFALDIKYAGETTSEKLARIRKEMSEKGASAHLLTTLDDICWILNVRGDDVDYFPLLLSYAIITMDEMCLYVDETKFSPEIRSALEANAIVFKPYNQVYDDIKNMVDAKILMDSSKLNYRLYDSIPKSAEKVEAENPEILMKCMKNPVEIENIRKAQIKDSVAHVRFMKWVKETYQTGAITELNAAEKLDELREEMGDFVRPSFDPICALGEHAAMCHYSSSPETNVVLSEGKLFLTDTGAGFMEGSTDITRTYALGEVPQIMKEHFTLVAISNLRLANVKFLKGCVGLNLDIIARQPFWERGLNYNHGTGHGVGYLLNIHEGPAGLRWQHRVGEIQELLPGMILTDEPGIYIEGSHGIRLENELLVCEGEKNEYGQFMYFDTLTFVPMDLDAIDEAVMTAEDKKLLNAYHQNVYKQVSPYLNEEEKEWLKRYTREI